MPWNDYKDKMSEFLLCLQNLPHSKILGSWFFFFFPSHTLAYRILVPQPGIKPMTHTVEARSPNHWTAGEFPDLNKF